MYSIAFFTSRGTVVRPSIGSACSSGRLGGTGGNPAVTLYRGLVAISTALVETGGLCPIVVQVILTQSGWYPRLDVASGWKLRRRARNPCAPGIRGPKGDSRWTACGRSFSARGLPTEDTAHGASPTSPQGGRISVMRASSQGCKPASKHAGNQNGCWILSDEKLGQIQRGAR